MLEIYNIKALDSNYKSFELSVEEVGREQCMPTKVVTYDDRPNWALHYVEFGEGKLITGGKEYLLKAGDIFVVYPFTQVSYFPIKNRPWTYSWIAFNGTMAENLLNQAKINFKTPVLIDKKIPNIKDIFVQLNESVTTYGELDISCIGRLYLIFSNVFKALHQTGKRQMSLREKHVTEVVSFVQFNHGVDITVKDIANSLNLNVNYLSGLCKKFLKMSPKQYIVKYRMERAGVLVKDTDMSINEIAKYVGFYDALHFSKEFSSFYGVAPTVYRKTAREK